MSKLNQQALEKGFVKNKVSKLSKTLTQASFVKKPGAVISLGKNEVLLTTLLIPSKVLESLIYAVFVVGVSELSATSSDVSICPAQKFTTKKKVYYLTSKYTTTVVSKSQFSFQVCSLV